MAQFKRENWIHIDGWMITDFHLSGSELLCFAIIRGFTQDGETEFTGSLAYLSSALNITKPNTKGVLDRLLKKGLIDKKEVFISGVKFCHYSISKGVIETITGYSRNNNGGIIETITDNNRDNDIDNSEENILFPNENNIQKKGTSEGLCLFRNSRYSAFEEFAKYFDKPEFEGVDIAYYYEAVKDWSDAGGKKKRDWIATARNFIRGDFDKGKLHKLPTATGLSESAEAYLKMGDFGI